MTELELIVLGPNHQLVIDYYYDIYAAKKKRIFLTCMTLLVISVLQANTLDNYVLASLDFLLTLAIFGLMEVSMKRLKKEYYAKLGWHLPT